MSVDQPTDLERMRESSGATFDFLSDADGELINLFGVRHAGGSMDGADIARSASFLLDRDGRLAWMRVAESFRVRPRPWEILTAVDELP